MSSVTPLIVTHPCALVRDGLRPILAKSPFRPVHILPALNEETESYLASAGACIWLVGVNECGPTTNDLVRRVVATNPSLRAVILTASHTANDILPAFWQAPVASSVKTSPASSSSSPWSWSRSANRSCILTFSKWSSLRRRGRRLAKSQLKASSRRNDRMASIQLFPPRLADYAVASQRSRAPASEQPTPGNDVVRSLSRRELVILRTLTEGASNKIIARKLVITESTVKVHMKAILRKLRLQNRTQAAIWARTHLGALLENAAA